MITVISAQEIAQAQLPLRDVYDLVLEGFRLHARGEYEMPSKLGVHTRPGALMHAMPVYLPSEQLAGTKLVSVYPRNPERGMAALSGVIAMFDPETGEHSEVIDAAWITNTRTAMVSMVDVAYLAVPNPVFGVIGATGASGRAHLDAIAEIFPGSQVLLNSRSRERCEVLQREFADQALNLRVEMNLEQLVRTCDVVIVVTSHLQDPILDPAWLRPGQNVLNVHTRAWPAAALDVIDVVSCDDRRQLLSSPETFELFPGLDPDLELGTVVDGQHPGRTSPHATYFSLNYGLAIFDVLVADAIRKRVVT